MIPPADLIGSRWQSKHRRRPVTWTVLRELPDGRVVVQSENGSIGTRTVAELITHHQREDITR